MAKKEKCKETITDNASFFDGKLLGQIGTTILALLALLLPLLPVGGLAVLGFTLFADLSKEILIAVYAAIGVFGFFMLWLGLAWATVIVLRWEYRHTVVDGKRLVFKGKKTALWGNFLKWFFLTVLTLLIYGLWVWIKMKKWVLCNVETVEPKTNQIPEKTAVNPYLPTANPYFLPPMQGMQNVQGAQGIQGMQPPFAPQGQGQTPTGYFPPYPYFPPMPPYPYVNTQNKKDS